MIRRTWKWKVIKELQVAKCLTITHSHHRKTGSLVIVGHIYLRPSDLLWSSGPEPELWSGIYHPVSLLSFPACEACPPMRWVQFCLCGVWHHFWTRLRAFFHVKVHRQKLRFHLLSLFDLPEVIWISILYLQCKVICSEIQFSSEIFHSNLSGRKNLFHMAFTESPFQMELSSIKKKLRVFFFFDGNVKRKSWGQWSLTAVRTWCSVFKVRYSCA